MSTEPSLLDTFRVQFLLSLKLYGRQHPVLSLLALGIIEYLHVVEYFLPRVIAGFVSFAPHTFALQEVEEALSNRVFIAVPSAAHAVSKIMLLRE